MTALIFWFWNVICFHCWNNLASKWKENGKSRRCCFPALKDTAWLAGGWESCPCVTCPSATVSTWGYHRRRSPCTSGFSSNSWICSWNKSVRPVDSCDLGWAAIRGLWNTNVLALQEKADETLWSAACNVLAASKHEGVEKSLWKRPLNNQGSRVFWSYACLQMPRSSHSPAHGVSWVLNVSLWDFSTTPDFRHNL